MSANPSNTLQPLLTAAVRGDEAARQQLIHHAYERLRRLARMILNADFPRLKAPPALLDTTDVANQTALALFQALDEIRPQTTEDFFRLAAQLSDAIHHLCAALDETDRRTLEWRLRGHSTAEVARELGLDADVLRVRLSRLRQRLRSSGLLEEWL